MVDAVVVAVIIAVVVGLLIPAVQKGRESAAKTTCQDNLHTIDIAIHNHSSGHNENFPALLGFEPGESGVGWSPFWFDLLPDMESTPVYPRARGKGAGWAAGNHRAVFKVLICPSDPSNSDGLCVSGAENWAGTSYAPNYFLFATEDVFDPKKRVNITQSRYTTENLPRGSSTIVAVVERFSSFPEYGWSNAAWYPMSHSYWGLNAYGSLYGAWGALPPQTSARPTGKNAAHPHYPNTAHKNMHVLVLDGSIAIVSGSIDRNVWERACKPDDNRPIGEDWWR